LKNKFILINSVSGAHTQSSDGGSRSDPDSRAEAVSGSSDTVALAVAPVPFVSSANPFGVFSLL